MTDEPSGLAQTVALANRLSPLDKVRLLEQVASTLEHDLASTGSAVLPRESDAGSPPIRSDSAESPTEPSARRTGWDFFGESPDLETLARQQGVKVHATFEELLGDFWPEDESVDDFIAAVRRWRRGEE